ncbi:hypothetical protein AVEN_49347-1 [Araneus ventricosus]|uniref:Uncharacterized protein n=1 Tax=Araneus ventricosus TaxID=182803 RepID=A0A4Y2LQ33_ARAVE|nr:hypothetical protein AVEN_49347-1 [Araneus ventricosus]
MGLEMLKYITFFAHVHWYKYNGNVLFPIEIGIAEALPKDVPEDRRRVLLVTVNNAGRRTRGDLKANMFIGGKFSNLSYEYTGKYELNEAERKVVDFVRGATVAVKGLEQRNYFEGLGRYGLELRSQVVPDCPKLEDLPEEVRRPERSDI